MSIRLSTGRLCLDRVLVLIFKIRARNRPFFGTWNGYRSVTDLVSSPASGSRAVVPQDFGQTIAPVLFKKRVGNDYGNHTLSHRRCRRYTRHVAPLVSRRLRLSRFDVNRSERLDQGGDRLHVASDDDRHPVRHAAFDPACVVGLPAVRRPFARDRIVEGRARPVGARHAVADLDRFLRLDRQDGLAEPAVELAVPVDVRSEARWYAGHNHFVHASQRVTLLLRFRNVLLAPLGERLVEHPDLASIRLPVKPFGPVTNERRYPLCPLLRRLVPHLPDPDDVTTDLDAHFLQKLP